MSQISPHDEFLELCAISTSGQLAGEERQRLQEHLAVCPSCREALEQYATLVSKIIPALARDTKNLGSDPSWWQEQAEAAFSQRLTLDEEFGMDRGDVNGDTASNFRMFQVTVPNEATNEPDDDDVMDRGFVIKWMQS